MNTVIVAAAGCGSRMKAKINKQFLSVNNIPVLAHTLKTFEECKLIDNIIIAAKKEDIKNIKELVLEYNITKVFSIVEGGATRQESVYLALQSADDNSTVLIHDGARPFLSHTLIEELIVTAEKTGGAAPGLIPKDTIAIVDKNNVFISPTVRTELRNLQTPQVFSAKLIKTAHQKAKAEQKEFTDDCSLFTFYGGKVTIVDGEETNIKITVPEDIILAEHIAKNK